MYRRKRLETIVVSISRGFSLVSAIFILVVLAALGAFMMTFATVQHTTSAEDVLGSSAYQAARTGVEWGAYQILQGVPATYCSSGAGTTTALPTLAGSLASFAVSVKCVSYAYTEAGVAVSLYEVTSTATRGATGGLVAVERQLKTTIAK